MCRNQQTEQAETFGPSLIWPRVKVFVNVVANKDLPSSFLLPFNIQLTPLLWWLVVCISERKIVIFLNPPLIIFISVGNYGPFNRELIHMCPLCVIRVHTRRALEVGP